MTDDRCWVGALCAARFSEKKFSLGREKLRCSSSTSSIVVVAALKNDEDIGVCSTVEGGRVRSRNMAEARCEDEMTKCNDCELIVDRFSKIQWDVGIFQIICLNSIKKSKKQNYLRCDC
ncbi:unnamed protein product [Hermetia illucens]|uniref:Uncharacterized protein n=1 Tax=Hermetia illucens TaxID=343691 RepID=A0A7R8YUF1_HERIL|nr:unnamed protein product [Hermetia illucens]